MYLLKIKKQKNHKVQNNMALKIKAKVNGLEKLKNHIEYVKLYSGLIDDKNFEIYIQNKFLETVRLIASRNLPDGELSQLYIENNKIRNIDGGFELYNDTYIETETEGYNGKFSVALSFEYGTGIVGQENPKEGAWQYNVNNHEFGWTYYKDGTFHFTRGFEGFEIYRKTKLEIENNLLLWVREYKRKMEV